MDLYIGNAASQRDVLSSDLEKILTKEQIRLPSSLNPELERLKGLPFWLWASFKHKNKHGNNKPSLIRKECCFNHVMAIHPSFDKLLTSLRTAVSLNDSYKLDKENTTYDDILDAFRLSLNLYRWRK